MERMEAVELRAKPWRTARDVKRSVCRRFGLTLQEIDSNTNKWRVAHPRQIAMALVRKRLGYSYPRIGREFGRDHTTAMWAARKWGIPVDPGAAERGRAARARRTARAVAEMSG